MMTVLNSYSLPEAATVYGIGYASLLSYVKAGYVNAFDVSKGTRPVYRVYEKDMDEFVSRYDASKKRCRVVKTENPASAPVATVKPDVISDLTRRQLENKNAELARIKEEIAKIEDKLMELLVELDDLTK